jgi:hypothetical protein
MPQFQSEDLYVSISLSLLTLGLFFLRRYYSITSRQPKVSALWIYPIKSCKGIQLKSANITRRGFAYDREFMLVDQYGKFVSQRTKPIMALITTSIDYDKKIMIVSAPNMNNLHIDLRPINGGSTIDVTVWGDVCKAHVLADEFNVWFSNYLNTPNIQFVRMAKDFVRPTDSKYAPNGQVIDYFK